MDLVCTKEVEWFNAQFGCITVEGRGLAKHMTYWDITRVSFIQVGWGWGSSIHGIEGDHREKTTPSN